MLHFWFLFFPWDFWKLVCMVISKDWCSKGLNIWHPLGGRSSVLDFRRSKAELSQRSLRGTVSRCQSGDQDSLRLGIWEEWHPSCRSFKNPIENQESYFFKTTWMLICFMMLNSFLISFTVVALHAKASCHRTATSSSRFRSWKSTAWLPRRSRRSRRRKARKPRRKRS